MNTMNRKWIVRICVCLMIVPVCAIRTWGASGSMDPAREADLKSTHDDVMRQIREREAEYEREQEKLRKTRKNAVDLARRERGLLKKLDVSERTLTRTTMEITALNEQMDELRKDIASTQEKLASESEALIHRRGVHAVRLKNLYLLSALAASADGLVSFGDLAAPPQISQGLGRIVRQDRDCIVRISAAKAETEKIQQLLAAKETALTSAQEKKLALQARQQRELGNRRQILDDVHGRKSAAEEIARRIEEENANMKILLTALREKSLKLKEQLAYLRKEFEDKKGLLRWPLEYAAISGVRPYGKIFDESIQTWRMNKGIDIVTRSNQSVLAVSRGEVVFADFLGRMGNLVILSHGCDYFTLYAHLAEIGVKLGGKIEAGSVIGRAGNTGLLEDGAVLHFEIREGSQAVDPEPWLGRRN